MARVTIITAIYKGGNFIKGFLVIPKEEITMVRTNEPGKYEGVMGNKVKSII